jgi:hypothetical protein
VAAGIHQGKISQHDLLGVAPVLLAAAADGDQIAGVLEQRLRGAYRGQPSGA